MKHIPFTEFGGVDVSQSPHNRNQLTFAKLLNYRVDKFRHGLTRVPEELDTGYDDLDLDEYGTRILGGISLALTAKGPDIVPFRVIREDASPFTAHVQLYDYTDNEWYDITIGSHAGNGLDTVSGAKYFQWPGPDGGSYCQEGNTVVVATRSGTPNKITNFSYTDGSGRKYLDKALAEITRLGAEAPTTALTTAVGAATGLTGTYSYVYTFYDSTSGWESSPSAISSNVTVANQKITITGMETTCYREDVDKKLIYRTISTNEQPFMRVAEVPIADVGYTDSIADIALGATSPVFGDHDIPPKSAGAVAAHNGRVWVSIGPDVYYSHASNGGEQNLEYFSETRKFSFPSTVVRMLTNRDGGLSVFLPSGDGIHEVQGNTEDTYEAFPIHPDEGVNYPQAVARHRENTVFWGVHGATLINSSGVVEGWGDRVNEYLWHYLGAPKSGYVTHVWCEYHPGYNMFLFGGEGLKANVIGVSPDGETVSGFRLGYDSFSSYQFTLSAYCPGYVGHDLDTPYATYSQSNLAAHSQHMFVTFYNGIAVDGYSKVIRCFDDTYTGTALPAEAVTNRIHLDEDGEGLGSHTLISLDFPGYLHDDVAISCVRDYDDDLLSFDDPDNPPTWEALTRSDTGLGTRFTFGQQRCRWFHLRMRRTTAAASDGIKPDISGFILNYIPTATRTSEES